ncbi:MAG: hypothetical protein ABSE05_11425 [Syntrophales bacterium]
MSETESQKSEEAALQLIAELIRENSRDGRILAQDEILNHLIDRQLFTSNKEVHSDALGEMLKELVKRHRDMEAVTEGEVQCYYSSQFMTRAYARIMLQKRIGRLQLIAEVVRVSSEINQRPVPLESFTRHPFGLNSREILDSLEAMATAKEYCDITRTATSASSFYLYSTRHLEPDHAAALAEWLDVGQFDNP